MTIFLVTRPRSSFPGIHKSDLLCSVPRASSPSTQPPVLCHSFSSLCVGGRELPALAGGRGEVEPVSIKGHERIVFFQDFLIIPGTIAHVLL